MGFQLVKLTEPPISITTNLNPMGAYDNATTYAVGDVVTYNGLSYLCRATTTGNLPTDTTYWQLVYDDTQKFITSRNDTGATLYKGTIVYLSGATGSNPNIVKAKADTDATSAQTFGVVYEDIANNSTGKVLGFGLVDGLDTRTSATNPFTSDTLSAGDILYLSPTTAGYVTNVKPSAPDHLVYVGFVVQTSPTDGRIVYRIQNGYELDELHNVLITSVANNQSLFYDSATSLWKNRAVAATDINANVSNTEFGYLDGVTSSIQTQIDGKQASLGYTAEDVANKDTDGTLAANSDTKYASQKATKTYIDTGLGTKQNNLTLTTTGTSGAATLVGATLNIPQYSGGGGGGGTTRTVVVTSGNTTAGSTAGTDYIYLVAGAHTITLPTAVSNTNRYTIKNNHSANITIDTTSSQTIDGTTTISIAPEESVDIISDNTNWRII